LPAGRATKAQPLHECDLIVEAADELLLRNLHGGRGRRVRERERADPGRLHEKHASGGSERCCADDDGKQQRLAKVVEAWVDDANDELDDPHRESGCHVLWEEERSGAGAPLLCGFCLVCLVAEMQSECWLRNFGGVWRLGDLRATLERHSAGRESAIWRRASSWTWACSREE
jgi:hypothetical protein